MPGLVGSVAFEAELFAKIVLACFGVVGNVLRGALHENAAVEEQVGMAGDGERFVYVMIGN